METQLFFMISIPRASVSAYIDPSAMTYIIQIIAGVAIAAGAAFGFYIRKLKRAFSKFGKNSDSDDSWDYDEDDDDDTGFGDYELPEEASAATPAGQTAEPTMQAPHAAGKIPDNFSAAAPEYAEAVEVPKPDIYDETGGEGGLLAENRELRRQLALEREKVEILMRALNVCTEKRGK